MTAKLFFEGNGLVLESKNKHPKKRWRGVPIVLTSNVLPTVMHEPRAMRHDEEPYQYTNRWNNFNAFKSRTDLIAMKTGYLNTEQFPYTEDELAIYMLDYI